MNKTYSPHTITFMRILYVYDAINDKMIIESDKTTSIYNVSTRVLSKK